MLTFAILFSISSDINKIHDGIGDKCGGFFQWFCGFLSGFIIGFIWGWKLTLVILAISPLLAGSAFVMTKVIRFNLSTYLIIWSFIFNPYMTNGRVHHYHLGESTVIYRGIRGDFEFLFHFSMKFLKANRIGASHLGLYCLLMSHKKDARLI